MPTGEEIKEAVRERYGALARGVRDAGCAGVPQVDGPFGAAQYNSADTVAPETAASFGCGNPTAVAHLEPGQVVLDLGSGAGLDVLLAAERVGPMGKVYGLDLTDDMLALARDNQAKAGVTNAEFLKGDIEDMPLPDGSVDVIISNCVISLAADKPLVLREAHRVLRRGGRLAVADIITRREFSDEEKADLADWAGCVFGALSESEYRDGLAAAGFSDIEIVPLFDVRPDIVSATIKATA